MVLFESGKPCASGSHPEVLLCTYINLMLPALRFASVHSDQSTLCWVIVALIEYFYLLLPLFIAITFLKRKTIKNKTYFIPPIDSNVNLSSKSLNGL